MWSQRERYSFFLCSHSSHCQKEREIRDKHSSDFRLFSQRPHALTGPPTSRNDSKETENISYFGLLRDFSVLASESNLETRSARAWSLDSRFDWWNRTGPLSAVGIGCAFCRRARNCPKTGSRRPFSLFFFCLVRTFRVVSRARFVQLPFVSSSFPVCSVRGEVILEMWVKPWRGARATFCAGSRPLTGRALVCACARREQRRNRRGTASVRRWIGTLRRVELASAEVDDGSSGRYTGVDAVTSRFDGGYVHWRGYEQHAPECALI